MIQGVNIYILYYVKTGGHDLLGGAFTTLDKESGLNIGNKGTI